MKIRGLIDVDFINYKKPAIYVAMPFCSWKCEKECGRPVCQNWSMARLPIKEISTINLIDRYDQDDLTEAIVFAGLEPFDSEDDLRNFIINFRHTHSDDIVIYTGYTEEEVKEKFNWIYLYENIIIKFGRFIPDCESHYDEVLGVNLASPNQYAKEINPL